MILGVTAADLMQIARDRTGLDDFGDDDFREGFERMIDSINRESLLTDEGREATRERFLRVLVNRLRFHDDLARHPEILETPILPPVVVAGLPRVGSTKMQRLLAESGGFQEMLFWQGYNPAPFPDAVEGEPDPRIEDAMAFIAWRARRNPASVAAHYMAATAPEEEVYLLEFSFRTYWQTGYFEIPSYLEWVRPADRDRSYGYLRKLFQYLQWQHHRGTPRPWLLKAPPNLGSEEHIARHFPGARFIVLHRDPVKAVPSVAAIIRELRSLYGPGPADYPAASTWALDEFSLGMNKQLAWRDKTPDAPIIDIAYSEIRDRPMDAVRRVFPFLGLELTPDMEQRMTAWLDDNEQHKHGQHLYSLRESGLTAAGINEKFHDYRQRFEHLLTE